MPANMTFASSSMCCDIMGTELALQFLRPIKGYQLPIAGRAVINRKPIHVWPRVMPDHIEVELAAGDHVWKDFCCQHGVIATLLG